MPHIQAVSIQAVHELSGDFPDEFRGNLIEIVLDLCHPDPTLRGRSGPKNKTSIGLLWLQRYVARFDVLHKAAGIKGVKKNA